MSRKAHWNGVYGAKSANELSWYAPHLELSTRAIQAVARPSSEIIDIGGGASTLVDDLLNLGFSKISVLDVSSPSLDITKARLGADAQTVSWIVADVTDVVLPPARYDVWHDRAVFHFLTEPADRQAYADRAKRSVRPGGHLIISAFSFLGPPRCSGLDFVRYDGAALARELGLGFSLEQELHLTHVTPAGGEQRFVQCLFRRSTRFAHT